MHMNDPISRLLEAAAPGGGWGYRADQPAHLEPTCLALLALTADPVRNAGAIGRGWQAVQSNAQADGSYRLSRGRPQAAWTTGLVLFTQATAGTLNTATIERLLTLEGKVLKADPEVADMIDIDVRLMGWPWAEDTFSWVEPTSWAVLALRAAGCGGHARVREGLRLLLDRAFASGGANYGNRTVLGRTTEPIPGPTAILLLALQGVDDPKIEAAKGYLRIHAEKASDLEHLGWIKLALSAHADDDATKAGLPRLDERIREVLEIELKATPGLKAGPLRLALAALALNTATRHPFRLKDKPQVAEGEPALTNRVDEESARAEAQGVGAKVGSFFRGVMVKGLTRMRGLPPQSGVHIGRISEYDIGKMTALMKEQFGCFRQHLPLKDKRVLLKPNLVEYHRDKVINTDPRFVDAVIQMIQSEGAAEIVVAEGPGHWRNVQYLVNESGLGDVLRKHGIRFVDINHDEPVKTLNLGRTTGLEYLYLSRTVLSAEVFVSLPKLKTHHWAGATLALKNLFGTLPGICYGWPKNELHWRGIPNSIVDIACTHLPHLAIVDGIIGMEGDGPLNGVAKLLGAIVMGTDLVAVDATCCRLMKIPPERLPTLVLAHEKRLGHVTESNIVQLGASVESLATAFEWPPGIENQILKG